MSGSQIQVSDLCSDTVQSPPLGKQKLGSAHIPPLQTGGLPAQKCEKNFGDNNDRSEGGKNKK